ncbi:hypothetical protein J6590_068578 [Homalodisca vitripennis]|nr:hypothetical protein J6590_068578 [Homalodisca vitripennis]
MVGYHKCARRVTKQASDTKQEEEKIGLEKHFVFYDNSRPHTVTFPAMKTWLETQRFDSDAELHAGINNSGYDGIEKLVSRYEKFLNLNGDYVEK